MKPIFIKKGTIYNVLILLTVICLGCGVYALSQNPTLATWIETKWLAQEDSGEQPQVSPEDEERLAAEEHMAGLLQQVTGQGNPEHQAVSFMVMIDENTDTTYIPKMLQIFADHDVEASFFVTGRFAENNKDLLKGILARKHELGNHSYSSISPSNLDIGENSVAIEKTYDAIREATGAKTKLYSPPYGVLEDDVMTAVKHYDMIYVLAGIDSLDWKDVTPEEIIGQVLRQAKAGSIVSIHPTKNTVEALPTLLKELQAKDLKFMTISDQIK